MEIKKYLGVKNVIIFAIEVVLFWIIFFLHCYFWINGKDAIAGALRMVLIAGMVIIIISFFEIIINFKKAFSANNIFVVKKIALVLILMVLFVAHIIMCFSFYDKMGRTISGCRSIVNKQETEDLYYFYVKHNNHIVEIECTKDIYDNLIVDEKVMYVFSYRILQYDNDEGVLDGSIDTTYYVDNRGKGIK